MSTKWVVVEYSGQDRANEVKTFDNWHDASRFVERTYSPKERDMDHPDYMDVGIRADYENGECEYVS